MQAMCFLRKAFPHTLMGDVGTRRSGCPRQATHVGTVPSPSRNEQWLRYETTGDIALPHLRFL